MADIQRYLDDIMEARYGEEVRGSIHDAIEMINTTSEEAVNDANEALDRAEKYIDATERANEAADKAETAADKANDAADNLDTHIDDGITERLDDVNQARDEAREAARKANKAAENAGGGVTTDSYKVIDFLQVRSSSHDIAAGKVIDFDEIVDLNRSYTKDEVDKFVYYGSSCLSTSGFANADSNIICGWARGNGPAQDSYSINVKNTGSKSIRCFFYAKNVASRSATNLVIIHYFMAVKQITTNTGGVSLSDLILEAQEELSKSREATSSANSAANEANEAATLASNAANEANEAATLASNAAQSVKDAVSQASSAAQSANQAAEDASEAAQSANQAAEDANINSQYAIEASGNASDAATQALSAADEASEAAKSVNEAVTRASTAADEASEAAQSANDAATQASSAAQSANSAAIQASSAAQSANSAAIQASSAADKANEAAQSANNAANDANQAAETANSLLVNQLVTISTSAWVMDSEGSYHAEAAVPGLNSTNIVIVDIVQQDNLIDEEIRDFWSKVNKVELGTGAIKIYSSESLLKDIQIKLIIYHGSTSQIAEAYIINRGVSAGMLKKSIEKATIELDPKTITYDGSQKTQKVKASYNETELIEGTDYILTDNTSTDAGDYNLKITGINSFFGEKQIPWKIEKAQGSITLDTNNIEIEDFLGAIKRITVTKVGDGNITFTSSQYVDIELSSNQKQLTITTKAYGSDTIIVTLNDGKNYKGSIVELNINILELDYDPVLENNSWEKIAKICYLGRAKKCWSLHDTKYVEIDGHNYQMEIIDFDHDRLHSSDPYYGTDYNIRSAYEYAAMTLCMKTSLMEDYEFDSNGRYWGESDIRDFIINTLEKYRIDKSLIDVARTVSKKTIYSNRSAMFTNDIRTTADKFFIPSASEVFSYDELNNQDYRDEFSSSPEGYQYKAFYYTMDRIKHNGNQSHYMNYYWMTRSYSIQDHSYMLKVDAEGNLNSLHLYNRDFPIALCVCI